MGKGKHEKSKNDIKNDTKKDIAKSKSSKKIILIRVFFIIIFLISVAYLIIWFFDNMKNKELHDSLSNYVSVSPDDSGNLLIDFENLKSINDNIYSWIQVNGTDINYPVVHYTDNDYYLNHSFDNSFNNSGCPFADYRAICDGTDKNLVIYGHNRRDRKHVFFS